MRTRLLVALTSVLATACPMQGPRTPHPLNDQTRYLCCNLRYEKTDITDVNYTTRGTMVPWGTPVKVLRVEGQKIQFQPTGHPPLTLVHKVGRKSESMDQYLDHLLLTTDPHTRIKAPGKRDTETARLEKLVAQGEVEKGMTRDQVLRSLGYPPAHRTPSIESTTWTYWQNRWATMVVVFDGDKVVRVER
jgi:hypothetical protein